MATPDPPPVYSVSLQPSTPPPTSPLPDYTFPTSFRIGPVYTEGLLVDIPQIKGHLALLNAFSSLKAEVEAATLDIPDMPQDNDKKWAWFVGLAVERFDVWCQALLWKDALQPLQDTLPPLDVLMVWHAYMLNPRWYAEDAQRILACKPLHELGKVFAKELHRLPEILDSPPTDARVTSFYQRLGLPFFYFQSAKVTVTKTIQCPACGSTHVVSYMAPGGTGYLQQGFSIKCDRADWQAITKETLCARKLAETISRSGDAPDSFLPGTFFTDSRAANQKTSKRLVAAVRQKFKHLEKNNSGSAINEELCVAILKDTNFSLAELRGKLGKDAITSRIMAAHLTPMIYSVELAGAVLRQGSFVKKMSFLGWTKPDFPETPEGELALQHALARYHAFLDLMSSAPASFFVPTLDIDLVWHTHQLLSAKYESDCMTYVGRFVDHDDKVDGVKLSSSFDLTCRAWKNRFNLPYTQCGCPPPGETFGQRLSRFLSSKPPIPPSYLVPPADKPELFAATHASEHNSVQFAARSKQTHDKAVELHRAHLDRQKRRIKRREEELNERARGDPYYCGYGSPFLLPVPLYYGGGVGGCVATNSALVDHGGACGNGNGVCGGGGCSSGGCGSGSCGGGSSCGGGGCGGGCGGGG